MASKLDRSWLAALVVVFALAPIWPADAKTPCHCGGKKRARVGTAEYIVQTAREEAAAHKFAKAEQLARKAATRAGRDSDVRARAFGVLAFALAQQGKAAEAVEVYKQAVALRLSAKRQTPDEVDDVAAQLQAMAALQKKAGDAAGARASMQRAVDLMAKQHGRNAEVTKLFEQGARAMR